MFQSLTPFLPTPPPRPGLKVEQGFLVTGSGKEVVQVFIDLNPVRFMPGHDRFACIIQSFKEGLGIPVTEIRSSRSLAQSERHCLSPSSLVELCAPDPILILPESNGSIDRAN